MLVWKDGKSRQFGKILTIHLHTVDCCHCEVKSIGCKGRTMGENVAVCPMK